MMKKIYKRKSNFTIVELLVAMGVFSILMLALMQFFTGAQQIWQKSSARSEVFENARVALDLIATDLQCAYYEMNHSKKRIFFAADDYDANSYASIDDAYDNTYEKIAFATVRSAAKSGAGSKLCQVKYWLDTSTADELYTLKVDEIWDDSADWKITTDMGSDISGIYKDDYTGTAFEKNGTANKIVPNVLSLGFKLYNKNGTEIDTANTADRFPYKVEITLTVVDKASFDRWKSVTGGATGQRNSDILKPGMRRFTRVVLIERGQYD